MIVKIAACCVTGCVLCVILRQSGKNEMALMTALAASAYILFLSFEAMAAIVENLQKMVDAAGLDSEIFKTIIKITGIAYVTQTASELCKDSGESALSGKVELSGKVMICAYALPMINSLFEVISDIL